jgi:hypothetical protein
VDSSEYLLAQTRTAMLEAAGVVPADLVRTVRRHRKLLNAKTTRFFAHDGVVTDAREVNDNDAQARAVELFYDVFGVKAPRAQAAASSLGVAIEIDPASGVIRVVAGSKTTQQPMESA